ncbi:sortase [Patescibacteria group bacterium]|nr:sortase [Patescibacteria group bacterium]
MPINSPGKKIYIKDESFDPIYKSVNYSFLFKTRMLSGLLMALGFLILGTQVILPLVFFKTQDTVIKPMEKTVLGATTGFKDFDFEEIKKNDSFIDNPTEIPEYFYITIPKLKIENAIVKSEFDGASPDEFLGHYKGSSLPGDPGDSFIYGHSVLPWFFNPKNYKTIFSTLGNLEAGDEITIQYSDKELIYRVEDKATLPPNEVKPLDGWKPKYLNESTVSLMTCWPAGTKTNRLIIRGILVN